MPRRPDRSQCKTDLQAYVSAASFSAAHVIFERESNTFESFSQMTELILFLAQHAFFERSPGDFVNRLARSKAMDILDTTDYTVARATRKIHITIDPEAYRFLEMLAEKYPGLCENRNRALELIYLYAGNAYKLQAAHFVRRLEEVRRLHPRVI